MYFNNWFAWLRHCREMDKIERAYWFLDEGPVIGPNKSETM